MPAQCIACGRDSGRARYCMACYIMPEASREMRRIIHQSSTAALKARLADRLVSDAQLGDAWGSMAMEELTRRGESLPSILI